MDNDMNVENDRNMNEVFGEGSTGTNPYYPYASLSEQQRAYDEQDRKLSLLSLVVDAGTAREKELAIIDEDTTPRRVYGPLTSEIERAKGASGIYPFPQSLTDELLNEVSKWLCGTLDNPEIIYDDEGSPHEAYDPYWLQKELATIATIINAIEEYGRGRLSLRFIAEWGEQTYQTKQQLRALGLGD